MSATAEIEPVGLACAWDLGAELGEGPVWRAEEGALWFVDIKGRRIHRLVPATGERRTWEAPAPCGFLAPVRGGGWIAGLHDGLARFDPRTGAFAPLPRFGPDRAGNRLNDGAVDRCGRLWFGTMDDAEAEATGALWRLDATGPAVLCDPGYVITNGPAFSPDGRTLYHVDTLEGALYAFDLAEDGTLSNRRPFARVAQGYADGPAVDAEGCVWVGLFGGWGLERFAPSGESLGRVRLPVSNVTKPAFGGPDLRTAYCTTARWLLTEAQRAAQPLAGAVFSFRVETPGLPSHEASLD